MESCKQWIYQNQDKMTYFFLLGAAIGGFNCLTRPDYNLVIYLYIYFIWDKCSDNKEMQSSEKLNSWFFLIFSVLIDVFWTLFWSGKWSHIKDFEKTIHVIVIITSWVAIGIKGFIIFAIGLVEWSSIKSSLPEKLQERLTGNYKQQQDV
jgi:uncharacterized membrane protein